MGDDSWRLCQRDCLNESNGEQLWGNSELRKQSTSYKGGVALVHIRS